MIFGITGGSGSGKSTVSELFKSMGADIIDTDRIAHEVTRNGSRCLRELCGTFGEDILLGDGSLNRQKLATRAFSDKNKTELLNRITHKYIKEETQKRIAASKSELIGIDGAVIIGSTVEPLCEKIVAVTADEEVRTRRIKERDNLTDEQARERLSAQPDDDFYINNSDYHIINDCDMETLKRRVSEIFARLNEE